LELPIAQTTVKRDPNGGERIGRFGAERLKGELMATRRLPAGRSSLRENFSGNPSRDHLSADQATYRDRAGVKVEPKGNNEQRA